MSFSYGEGKTQAEQEEKHAYVVSPPGGSAHKPLTAENLTLQAVYFVHATKAQVRELVEQHGWKVILENIK